MRTYNDAPLMEKTVDSEKIFDGKILHIEVLTNELPNGVKSTREIVRHIGAAAVVPVDDEGNVYLVRQFRAPFGRVLTEIPAGKLDAKNEDPLAAAKRELKEETGMTASDWQLLNVLYTTVGFSDEKISIYLARGLSYGETDPDDDEFLGLVKMPYEEALQMVMNNELHDSKTVCGLLMTGAYIKK
ncbi:MAG: NUDIX hydrolase [Clostridia bacterium]|nr:NUDIX hydrolase [Clostridia bacterium]